MGVTMAQRLFKLYLLYRFTAQRGCFPEETGCVLCPADSETPGHEDITRIEGGATIQQDILSTHHSIRQFSMQ
jgi:hypothetical protein